MHGIPRLLRTPAAAFSHDLLMIPLAWFGAYWLRFNLELFPAEFWQTAVYLLPVVVLAQGSMFWYFGLYRGIWRFASMPDVVQIVKAVTAGLVITVTVVFLLAWQQGTPRSVFVLDGVLLLLLLGGPRFLYRWIKDRHLYAGKTKRALIVGAGRAGEMLARDLLSDPMSPYHPVAFADDDRTVVGKELRGLRVAGTCDEIPSLAKRYAADITLIAFPTASPLQLRRVVEFCEISDLPFRILPRVRDLISGRVTVNDLREVTVDDLLGREEIHLDWQAIAQGIHGRTILVTGGGGSIGSELCRQIVRHKPARLVVLERSEFNLFETERELRRKFPALELVAVLGDVTDVVGVDAVMKRYAPDVVYHAAAYKHVSMLQQQLRAAVANNILGTRVIAEAAHRHGCGAFVLISTDKAVIPGNVMGATKRVSEMICQHLAGRSKTRFLTVRFGNVLGSSGSVVPLFREQIARGGPVTVTHPETTRYFMTIPEACQLILQAGVIGKGGEILALDMGEPIRIAYLAEQMIRLSGRIPGDDIKIEYIGLRPGEKLHEELFHHSEILVKTGHPKILLAAGHPPDDAHLEQSLGAIERACMTEGGEQLRHILNVLVQDQPEQLVALSGGKKVISPWPQSATVVSIGGPKQPT